jgi:hypothetical protein
MEYVEPAQEFHYREIGRQKIKNSVGFPSPRSSSGQVHLNIPSFPAHLNKDKPS